MTKTPVIPEIQWHEGMLLSPQHFQQMELRNAQILKYHLHRLSPFYWGIHHLKLDPVVLSSGLFRLLEIDAVMPDGLIVNRHSDSDAPIELDLTPLKEDLSKEELTVYLVVPERTVSGSPISGEWPRYISADGAEVIDDNAPDNVIRIPRLIPKVSLMAGPVPPARYEYIPLARMTYQDESYILTPFIPPCFIVHQNSPLGDRLATLAMKMREKSSYLIEKWQTQVGTELLKETGELLRPLAESIPILEAIVGTGKTHPFDLYLTMCTIAGRLATLRLSQAIPSFAPYHHNDILSTMVPILDWMDRVTRSIEQTYVIVPFIQNDRLFYHKLSSTWSEDSLLIGVRIPTTMDAAEMSEWVRECVIASESHLESARMRRVTGAARLIIEGDELADLMPGSGLQLYRVQMDPQYIKPGEKLMIFHAADQPNMRPSGIVLYARGPYSLENEPTEQEG
ncbi:MAG: type VI secretion system baseplate subunit TssK [Alphaproteobacteria bacterium]|jgi:type VI secretion system protein ImpJ|nr:type VI secretion system baseplate subunit TssK [Alphaproteobacteria bacterium]